MDKPPSRCKRSAAQARLMSSSSTVEVWGVVIVVERACFGLRLSAQVRSERRPRLSARVGLPFPLPHHPPAAVDLTPSRRAKNTRRVVGEVFTLRSRLIANRRSPHRQPSFSPLSCREP